LRSRHPMLVETDRDKFAVHQIIDVSADGGADRVGWMFTLAAAAYNLIRMRTSRRQPPKKLTSDAGNGLVGPHGWPLPHPGLTANRLPTPARVAAEGMAGEVG
jgi:hypothetical protein